MTPTLHQAAPASIVEGLAEINGQDYYAVPDVDRMDPFLMSVVSDGDRWMFVSSTGGLTAGRVDASGALFAYETDDRLHRAAEFVGPATVVRVATNDGEQAWRPFHRGPSPSTRRCLYKSVVGDSIIFEELHRGLQLTFRYRWASSDRFGFVRTATLVNHADRSRRVQVVDGLLDLLPFGLDPDVQLRMGNLASAYRRSEVIDTASRLAVFSLESSVNDRPEPAEVLRATVAWSVGLDGASVTVAPDMLTSFELGRSGADVPLLTGRPGAYLLRSEVDLHPDETTDWQIVTDVGRDQAEVADLRALLTSEVDVPAELAASVDEATEALVRIMAPADALQATGDPVATAHHFANVTYNVMRGGVPVTGYRITAGDFADFVSDRNRRVGERHRAWFESLPEFIDRHTLLEGISGTGDPHLMRLGLEYLPFSFSRRHGDPSRPWNVFSIRVRDEAGHPIVYYEGNWRDIFQNWEALCMSFPGYLTGAIAAFVDASTPDGFNPYRITTAGIDWETPDPEDPWSNIGYWGDHQIVYLLRMLEAADRFLPGEVGRLLDKPWFCYADVPYRLAPYEELIDDPKATIRYDELEASRHEQRVSEVGGDGKLLWDADGEVYLVPLLEKLVVPALTKLSNFVPDGGIWMNTQRPEWNDANNALAGYGLSMVTLCHLRRYLDHLRTLVEAAQVHEISFSSEVAEWLTRVTEILHSARPATDEVTGASRKRAMDELGGAFSEYRGAVYASGYSGRTPVTPASVVELCRIAIEHLDRTIGANRRTDGLYHSYNLIHFAADGSAATVEPLPEMLEGQVAVLDSGLLSPDDRAEVVEALFSSAMYRADQSSFMLYPVRALPSFLEKNVVPTSDVEGNPLLQSLHEAGDRSIVAVDAGGRFRFNAGFGNHDDLDHALDRLAEDPTWKPLVESHRAAVLETYEEVFDHHAYTGRSGSMYGYEGIGSIYWHMVAKLLVAVQESLLDAASSGASPSTIQRLTDAYWRVRSGLGFNKSAAEFGAIPIDPYSHTPGHSGAQQPGMTGLVKEELLARPLELGVHVDRGEIQFTPLLLRERELLQEAESWLVYDVANESRLIELAPHSLGMTLCALPVVVASTPGDPEIEILYADGTSQRQSGLRLPRSASAEVFGRSGRITQISAFIPGDFIAAGPASTATPG